MNAITQTLLASAAFGALAIVPAVAGDVPDIHFVALHPGHAKLVSKTGMHTGDRTHLTSTLSVFTSVPASDLDKKVKLANTFYAFFDSGSYCNAMKKFKLQERKTQYAKLGYATLTLSGYCGPGPTVFYGNSYKLINPQGEGKTDSFVSSMTGKITYEGKKYKLTRNLDVSVAIGE